MEAPLAASSPPAVEAIALTRRFGDVLAADSVSFTIAPGEIFGLIGPNGAGKSTLIKMLTTLLPPTGGTARVAGFDIVTEAAKVRRMIGYVPQLVSADGALTGYENMLLSARLYAISGGERRRRISDALAVMGLSDAADRLVQHYSGGMIRRLEIAQAMLHRPAVLFLDEPTVGLDPVARRSVWDHVLQLRSTIHSSIVITTHYMEEADEMCDRIAVLHNGRIEQVGTPAALKATIGPGATLDDVFAHLTGAEIDTGGSYRETRRTRADARKHS